MIRLIEQQCSITIAHINNTLTIENGIKEKKTNTHQSISFCTSDFDEMFFRWFQIL